MTDAVHSAEQAPARALPPWWTVVLVAVLLVGLAFAIGRFSTFGTGVVPPGTDSPEAGFARDMQIHHTQAIEMSMEIYRKTDDDDVRMLSYDIATAQAAQKGEFYDWLVKWNLRQAGGPLMAWMDAGDGGHAHGLEETASDADLLEAMGMASADELNELDAATGVAADCLYLDLMITHHEGAVPMAEALVDLGSEPRALQVAAGIVQTQSAEIDLMRSLQERIGCS